MKLYTNLYENQVQNMVNGNFLEKIGYKLNFRCGRNRLSLYRMHKQKCIRNPEDSLPRGKKHDMIKEKGEIL